MHFHTTIPTEELDEITARCFIGMCNKPLCLDCHSETRFADRQFTSHSSEDVNCASCHSGHAKAGQMLKDQTPDLCYGCHMDVRADFYMPSHHPVVEGKLDCQSYHNIHGTENEFVMGEDSRELCFTCHADKEGLFLFEHEPVNEDCKMCHVPHDPLAQAEALRYRVTIAEQIKSTKKVSIRRNQSLFVLRIITKQFRILLRII